MWEIKLSEPKKWEQNLDCMKVGLEGKSFLGTAVVGFGSGGSGQAFVLFKKKLRGMRGDGHVRRRMIFFPLGSIFRSFERVAILS